MDSRSFIEVIPDISDTFADPNDKSGDEQASLLPCGRELFVMEEYAGNLIIFGGRVALENSVWDANTKMEKNTVPSINDVWRYNIHNNHWMKLFPSFQSPLDASFTHLYPSVVSPPALSGSSSVIVDGYLYIFGGRYANNSLSSQLWAFDITGRNWSLCTCFFFFYFFKCFIFFFLFFMCLIFCGLIQQWIQTTLHRFREMIHA
jgi:hypothetical protein